MKAAGLFGCFDDYEGCDVLWSPISGGRW